MRLLLSLKQFRVQSCHLACCEWSGGETWGVALTFGGLGSYLVI